MTAVQDDDERQTTTTILPPSPFRPLSARFQSWFSSSPLVFRNWVSSEKKCQKKIITMSGLDIKTKAC